MSEQPSNEHQHCFTPKIGDKWVNPQLAQDFLALPAWYHQRMIRDFRVAEYATAMRNGLWGVSDSSIVIVTLDGVRYVFNGRHRFKSVIESEYAGLFPWQEYQVCRKEEADKIYGRIDRPLPRSVGDTLPQSIGEELEISMKSVEKAVSALELIIRGFQVKAWRISDTSPITNNIEVRVRALRDWANQIGLYHNLVAGCRSVPKMLRSDIEAVALVTLRWQREKAETFWRMVAMDDGLRADTGPHALRKMVDGVGSYAKEPAHVRAKAAATCWNAWIGNRVVKYVKVYEESRSKPIKIDGTPYSGESFLVQHYELDGWTASDRGNLK